MSSQADILIIGGGLAGTSLAWHLGDAVKVTLLDQAASHCSEASAQNAGMVRRLALGQLERTLACRSHDRLFELPATDWCDGSPATPIGAVIGTVAPPTAELQTAAADLAARGIAIEKVDPAAIAEIAPALRGARVHSTWYLPDEAVCDSYSLGSGFVRGARRRGVGFEFGVQVTGLIVADGRVRGVETATDRYYADTVVLATAAWSEPLATALGLHRPLAPLGRHLFCSTAHPLSTETHPWCWLDDAGLYLRPETGGFLCSPCDETRMPPPVGPGSRHRAEELGRAHAHDKLTRFLPAVADLRWRDAWIGLRTFAADRRPLIGPDPDMPGLAWLSGLGGFGLTCALALGELAADCILGREVDWIDAAEFAPGRGRLSNAAQGGWEP